VLSLVEFTTSKCNWSQRTLKKPVRLGHCGPISGRTGLHKQLKSFEGSMMANGRLTVSQSKCFKVLKASRFLDSKRQRSGIRLLVESVSGLQTRANPCIFSMKNEKKPMTCHSCFLDTGSFKSLTVFISSGSMLRFPEPMIKPTNLILGFINSVLLNPSVIPCDYTVVRN
jgi:hypothetical protein